MEKLFKRIGVGICYGVAGATAGAACGAVIAVVIFWGQQDFVWGVKTGAWFGCAVWGITAAGTGMMWYEEG